MVGRCVNDSYASAAQVRQTEQKNISSNGTPSAGGQFSATIAVRDSTGASASKTFTLEVFELETDKYGGLVSKPCPNGPKAHF